MNSKRCEAETWLQLLVGQVQDEVIALCLFEKTIASHGSLRLSSHLSGDAGRSFGTRHTAPSNAIAVITDKDEVQLRGQGRDRGPPRRYVRQLIAVPHDRGVADGDLVTLEVLKPETWRAYKEIAAAIVDGYR